MYSTCMASILQAARDAQTRPQVLRLGLPPQAEEHLRFFFCDFSGVCGLRSSFGAQMDALQNAGGGGSYAPSDSYFLPERWAMLGDPVQRRGVDAAYHAIKSLEARGLGVETCVLYHTYGPRNRMRDWTSFHDVAQMVHLTPRATELAQSQTRKLREKLAHEIVARLTYEASLAPLYAHRHKVQAGSVEELRARMRGTEDRVLREELANQIRGVKSRALTLCGPVNVPTFEDVVSRLTVQVSPSEAVQELVNTRAIPREQQTEHVNVIRREAEHMHAQACAEYMKALRAGK